MSTLILQLNSNNFISNLTILNNTIIITTKLTNKTMMYNLTISMFMLDIKRRTIKNSSINRIFNKNIT